MSAPAGEGVKSGLSIMEVAGSTVNIRLLLNFSFIFHLKGGKRGVEGETSAADRETRKKAKVQFQMTTWLNMMLVIHPG